jgi:hypothetical protein
MSYSGVAAHHENGKAEDIQDLARSSLMHAIRRWRTAIDIRLWPYALWKAIHSLNYTTKVGKDKCPMEILSRANVSPNPNHAHPVGCPMYVYQDHVSAKVEKWIDRSQMTIHLGPSHQYSRSCALALSLTTGLVSPQFHAKFDDEFTTVSSSSKNELPVSMWQQKSHFTPKPKEENLTFRNERRIQPLPITVPNPADIVQQIAPNVDQEEMNVAPTAPEVEPPEIAQIDPMPTPIRTHTTTHSGRVSRPPAALNDFQIVV